MKTILLATFLFFLSIIHLYAQKSKFKLGLEVSPNYSFATVFVKESLHDSIKFIEELSREEVFERRKASVNTKIFTEYELSQKTKIGIGFGFQNNGSRYTNLKFGDEINSENGDFTISNIDKLILLHTHYYIEVPLYLKYYISDKIYSKIGISSSYNILNKSIGKIFYKDQSVRIYKEKINLPFRKVNINGKIGFGIDYFSSDKITLFAHPYAQYSLLGQYTDVLINRKMLSVGIALGIKI